LIICINRRYAPAGDREAFSVMTMNRLLRHARAMPNNLRKNSRHQFAAAHALRVFRSNAIYTYIPKNACSTMRLSLAIANGCLRDQSDIEWIHENNDTFRADLEALIRADYTFVILRDPYVRLASCFLDKFVSKLTPARRLIEIIDRKISLDDITFVDFVEMLGVRESLLADDHWRPQAHFQVYENYDDYFAVENFADAIPVIQERAGIEIVDARSLTGHGLDRYRLLAPDSDHSRTPVAEIAEMQSGGECPHPRSLYTKDLATAATGLYEADLRLYRKMIKRPMMFRAGV
jgi:hypothetical protein